MKEQISHNLETAMTYIEIVIAFILVFLAIFGLGYLFSHLIKLIRIETFLGPKEIHKILDIALSLFLAVELFRIAIAYIAAHTKVLSTVIEAAFVAVARKVVLYDFRDYHGIDGLYAAISLAIIMVVLAYTYYVVNYKKT